MFHKNLPKLTFLCLIRKGGCSTTNNCIILFLIYFSACSGHVLSNTIQTTNKSHRTFLGTCMLLCKMLVSYQTLWVHWYGCTVLIYSRWKTHKWRKCQLVPWFLRQDSPGAQETCGLGLQTRGIVKQSFHLFVSRFPLHLHWTIPHHRKFNVLLIWSSAMRQQMDVPGFREKAGLLRAHFKSSHLQEATQSEAHQQ